jgi:hypothetical protein
MTEQICEDFFLVGGTATALHLGHRISIDLDLFSQKEFDAEKLKKHLAEKYNISSSTTATNTLSTFVNFKDTDIKVEFISYKYKLLKPIKIIDGIKLLELDDLIPMKLSAIAGRGSKKDFFDIYFLFNKYNLSKMLDLFKQKFETENLFHILKSLTFFDDADKDPEPNLLEKVNWDEVKKIIVREVYLLLK